MAKEKSFTCGPNTGNPERANQNAGFALSSPLVDSAMQARKKTVRIQISRPPIMQNGTFFPSRFDCD